MFQEKYCSNWVLQFLFVSFHKGPPPPLCVMDLYFKSQNLKDVIKDRLSGHFRLAVMSVQGRKGSLNRPRTSGKIIQTSCSISHAGIG